MFLRLRHGSHHDGSRETSIADQNRDTISMPNTCAARTTCLLLWSAPLALASQSPLSKKYSILRRQFSTRQSEPNVSALLRNHPYPSLLFVYIVPSPSFGLEHLISPTCLSSCSLPASLSAVIALRLHCHHLSRRAAFVVV